MTRDTIFTRILQANVNRSWTAYDLLKQHMIELNVGLAVISEPPRGLPVNNTCFLSLNNLAAIIWRPEGTGNIHCRSVYNGRDFVVVRLGDILIVASYISPNISVNSFSKCLNNLSVPVQMSSIPQFICGDFNAKSTLWNCSDTNRRGELTERWAATHDLRLLNTGNAFTCIRPQGCSIVDLSWATSSLMSRVYRWKVLQDVETFSDHQYIEILLRNPANEKQTASSKLRWNFKKLDDELFMQVIEFLADSDVPKDCVLDPEKYATWISAIMRSACDVAAPVIRVRNNRRQVYWWSDRIAELRRISVKCRRIWTRCKRDNNNTANTLAARKAYAAAKKNLRIAIKRAKSMARAYLHYREGPLGITIQAGNRQTAQN